MTEKIIATVERVTPEIAEAWLGKNDNNRNLRQRVVSAYARDMAAGNWRLTGEAIKFGRFGRLQDGQHRLHGVIEAGVAVHFLVVRGLGDGVREVIDSGTGRTVGDALRMRGEPLYSSVAAAARLAWLFETSRELNSAGFRVTHSEVLEFLDTNKDFRPAIEFAGSVGRRIDMPVSVIGLAAWILLRVDSDDAYKFFTQLAEKTNLRSGDAILALIERLAEIRRTGRIATRGDYLSLIFRAWNYWRAGKPVQSLVLKTRDGSAVTIPEPK